MPGISISAHTCAADPPDATPVKCGRGLAPDSGGSVGIYLTETPLSGASPLPHLISVCQGRPSGWLVAVFSFIGRTRAANPPDTTPVKCGRGLAPDSGGSVGIYLAETPPSGASPLPHLISVCQGRPRGGSWQSWASLAVTAPPIFQTQHRSNVGGGLLPIAVGQSASTWLKHRHRGQAPSHIGSPFVRADRGVARGGLELHWPYLRRQSSRHNTGQMWEGACSR